MSADYKQFAHVSITRHDAKVVLLECQLVSMKRLFTAPELDAEMPPQHLEMLRTMRDELIEQLKQNLVFARRAAR